MKCLRIYASPDGESHFGEVDIPMTMKPAFPNEAPFEISAFYPGVTHPFFSHSPRGPRRRLSQAAGTTPRHMAGWPRGI